MTLHKLHALLLMIMTVTCPLFSVLLHAADPHHRPLTIDDLFELEEMGRFYGGPYSFSPDGNALAFVRVRPQKLTKDFSMGYLAGAERSDIWIQKRLQDMPIKLTNGEEDSTRLVGTALVA